MKSFSELFAWLPGKNRKRTWAIIASIMLISGIVQLSVPSDYTKYTPSQLMINLADSEMGDTRNSLLLVWGVISSLNGLTSTVMEAGGAFTKFIEPVDDQIERVSSWLFVLTIFSSILSFTIEPIVIIGFILFGIGKLGCLSNRLTGFFPNSNIFKKITWLGGFGAFFPIIFFISMWVLSISIDNKIIDQYNRFQQITASTDIEKKIEEVEEKGGWLSWLNFGNIFSGAKSQINRGIELAKNVEVILEVGTSLVGLYLLKFAVFPVVIISGSLFAFRVMYKKVFNPVLDEINKKLVEET